jgi:hypothetical protein
LARAAPRSRNFGSGTQAEVVRMYRSYAARRSGRASILASVMEVTESSTTVLKAAPASVQGWPAAQPSRPSDAQKMVSPR